MLVDEHLWFTVLLVEPLDDVSPLFDGHLPGDLGERNPLPGQVNLRKK
jgi:hypothetical protein